jgi:hypothetical protein
MILGILIRVVLEFLRRRGVPVPDPSRLRSRKPVIGLTDRVVGAIFPATTALPRQANDSRPATQETNAGRGRRRRARRSR